MPEPPRPEMMPRSVARLERDPRGYPIPWFVQHPGDAPGEPDWYDFRVMNSDKLVKIIRGDRSCWICGQRLPRLSAYVIGPMCAVNRVSSEPTSHVDCAIYAAIACPFLSNPRRTRQEGEHRPMPNGVDEPAGKGVMRNPGVALVWIISGRPKPFKVPDVPGAGKGYLFNIGTPVEAKWYAHGREATRAEVEEALESGMPTLREHAPTPLARATLSAHYSQARKLLPAA